MGTGDLSEVYKIQRKQDEQFLALKLYRRPHDGSFRSSVKLNNKETDIMKNLDHPLTIRYIDEFYLADQRCVVTELASCGDLQNLINIRRNKNIPFS